MKNIDQHKLGSFAWFELATTDQSAAKKFYSSLFGWDPVDMPMGPDATYTMFRIQGRDAAGGYTLMPQMRDAGVPPHWALYIAVSSADETAAKVAQAGGTVVMGPIDVFDIGRMIVVRDPTGAMINFWQEKRSNVNRVAEAPGTVCWADLNTQDVPKGTEFYGKVLGWKWEASEHDHSGYLHIKNGDEMIGGAPPSHMLPPNVPPHWMLYFLVSDVDASTRKLAELGGKVFMGPMDIPNAGRFSIVTDPQGAAFALFTMAQK